MAPMPICVNCGLPTLEDHVHCSRMEMCVPPNPLCRVCAEESGYTCYKCELELRELQQ